MADSMCEEGQTTPIKNHRSRPRIPLQPTAGNGPSPSPRKAVRTARDFYDSQEEDHSGKESPFKSPSKGLKLKRSPAKPAQPLRSLKLNAPESLLPSAKPKKVADEPVISPPKTKIRESPRRRAKVDYAIVAGADSSDADDASDGEFKAKAGESSDDDNDDVFSTAPRMAKPAAGRSVLGTGFPKLSPKKNGSPAKLPARPVRSSIFDDSDNEQKLIASPSKRQRRAAASRLSISSTESVEECGAALKFSIPASSMQPATNETPTTPEHKKLARFELSPTKTKLLSPTRKVAHVPTPPQKQGRPSLDAFWDQAQVNDWNETHSPRKDLKFSPRKLLLQVDLSSSSSSDEEEYMPKRSPKKTPEPINSPVKGGSLAAKKAFSAQKQDLAKDFFHMLDEKITEGQIGTLAESGGGVSLIWSKKLNSTAGRANWKREAVKRLDKTTNVSTTVSYRHIASIELAEKVIDTEARLYNVLAHEYCHLANFMISRVINNPHGASFKTWAKKVTLAFGDSHGVEVTTKHDYEIEYKYIWMCASEDSQDGGCGTEYKRHSKSIDPDRHTCGRCKGRLTQIKPKPRKAAASSGAARAGGASEYQKFVKEQFQTVKLDLPPGSPMKEVMKEIGVRYRTQKASASSPEKSVEIVEVSDVVDEDMSSDVTVSAESPKRQDMADVDGIARKLDFLQI